MRDLIKRILGVIGSERMIQRIVQSSDLVLAGAIMLILTLMIMPVPPLILDLLIGINILISILLLMVATYIPSAVHLSVFPSLLLFTTLYRLGLNISTTRGILLHADAGEVIYAVGNFVMGGNYVVGFIIFLIITLVQFIVITKGAERVAEVAARFTLDALPGKQMSIDADMRAGMLDAQQARMKRLELQKESQLYGAMDGAMKFVKGDAIASIVITLINIIGGMVIGNMSMGMTIAESLKTFALLSIGDGLISQIPALMISISAGIVTTRVNSDVTSNLGRDISTQLLRQPKGMMLASIAIFMMGLLPGFPFAPFAVLALLTGGLSYGLWEAERQQQEQLQNSGMVTTNKAAAETQIPGHTLLSGNSPDPYAFAMPIMLELGPYLVEQLEDQTKHDGPLFVNHLIPKMRQGLFDELGVRFPSLHLRTKETTVGPDEYGIFLNEVLIVKGQVVPKHVLVGETEEHLGHYNIPFLTYPNPHNLPVRWVEERYVEILEKVNMPYWRPLNVVLLHLTNFLKEHAHEFIGIQEMRQMLIFVEKRSPDLVKEATRFINLQKLADIFRRLVQEQISIKDLRTILEALTELSQTEKDTALLTESLRASLKRFISYKYSRGRSIIAVYIVDPEIEDMVRGAIKQTSSGAYLGLDPDAIQLIVRAVRSVVSPTQPDGQPPVLITAIDVRRFIRKLMELEMPHVAVISYQEIAPNMSVQPVGRIQLT